MKKLIERSYKAIVGRGLITPTTYEIEFIRKLEEELDEVRHEFRMQSNPDWESYEKTDKYIQELTDLATVAIMQIHHLGYNFINEFEKVVQKNEKRALQHQNK